MPLPQDVLNLIELNKDFYRTGSQLPPCLKLGKTQEETNHCRVMDTSDEQPIPVDPSRKPLKPTPKRTGS
ncbi:hypothetical protein WR25_21396 [Diploscapter pachys]|uniref:Uncharacterized protein n=1 Tax=Diploscapter pachys TaxID=2018661 RepID=A0A2A2JCC2_9BILA|nr:hypothetical protein WR25_21396 [Diploscapter pachys]